MARGWLVFLGLVIAVACSGRTKRDEPAVGQGAAGDSSTGGHPGTGGSTGGRAAATGGSVAASGGSLATTGGVAATGGRAATSGGASSSDDCAIAFRHDRCCPEPEPVTRGELESDACLQEWTPLVTGAVKPPACDFPQCGVPCPAAGPATRSVAPDSEGTCRFVSECETARDCVSLYDATACCPCEVALPNSWASALECLVALGGRAQNCNTCGDVACEPCPEQGELVCVDGSPGLQRCEYGKTLDLPPDQCAAEQDCGENPMHACTVCVAAGEAACGGPPPPPDECESDADCRERADNLNCEQPPCQNKRCVQGCLLDDDCGESEICDDYHCRPAPCSGGATCSPNHVCVSQLCVRRTCKTSAECGDYCVNGACYDTPGRCEDGCLP